MRFRAFLNPTDRRKSTALALRARVTGDARLPIDLRFDNPGELAPTTSASLAEIDALIAFMKTLADAPAGTATGAKKADEKK